MSPAEGLVIVVSEACPNSMPVNCGESPVPKPKLVLAVFAFSATQFVPSPTIKLPSVTAKPAISAKPASYAYNQPD